MSWVTDTRQHRNGNDPCTTESIHLTLLCEDCDTLRLSRMTLDRAASLMYQGRITQDDFEAYDYVWALLSPYRGTPAAPNHPDVRRIARKLLRVRSFDLPVELVG